jgi:hypothetical protein
MKADASAERAAFISLPRAIQFAITKFLAIGSQVP